MIALGTRSKRNAGSQSRRVGDTKVAADLNDDGAVNGDDYNEMLRIFTAQGHS